MPPFPLISPLSSYYLRCFVHLHFAFYLWGTSESRPRKYGHRGYRTTSAESTSFREVGKIFNGHHVGEVSSDATQDWREQKNFSDRIFFMNTLFRASLFEGQSDSIGRSLA